MFAPRAVARCGRWRVPYLPRPRGLHDLYRHPQSKFLKVSEEVRDAVATGKPVVALETTIYTHGRYIGHICHGFMMRSSSSCGARFSISRKHCTGISVGIRRSSQRGSSSDCWYSQRNCQSWNKCRGNCRAGLDSGTKDCIESLSKGPGLHLWHGTEKFVMNGRNRGD